MLTVKSLKSGQQRYYIEQVGINYYTESGEPPGIWARGCGERVRAGAGLQGRGTPPFAAL